MTSGHVNIFINHGNGNKCYKNYECFHNDLTINYKQESQKKCVYK